jgi:4-hydroxybenzoate polyprenyltransferase
MALLRLIRWTNLLIIFLTQLLVWACIIYPLRHLGETHFLLSFPNFIYVSLSTVLIAAAGYIINDYFDVRIDNINKPEKMVLEKMIPRRLAIIFHTTLNVVALLLALIVAWQAREASWLLVQLSCTFLLWFYSTHFKRRFMIGNVVVALLTSLTIIVLIIYEPAMHYYLRQPVFVEHGEGTVLPNPVWVLSIYTYFAFVLTWMREIVKDMEDFKGDEAEGCVTMPIQWGLKKATHFTQALGLAAIVPLIVVSIKLIEKEDWLLGGYTIIGLIIPISLWLAFLQRKATTTHYSKASRWLKIIMVLGIGSLVIYYFEANA